MCTFVLLATRLFPKTLTLREELKDELTLPPQPCHHANSQYEGTLLTQDSDRNQAACATRR